MTASFQTAADLFGDWRDDLLTGKPPVLYSCGDGELSRVEIGPGLVTLFGGAPGAGKTALVMQLTCEALRRTPDLRALVCNVEMPPRVLLDRQLARLSGIDAATIRHRRFGPDHDDRRDAGLRALGGFNDRLAFVRPPFDLENIADSADAFGADVLVCDYIQRVGPRDSTTDRRGSIDKTMGFLRRFADAGVAVVVVAALARQKDGGGRSSYHPDALSLASFRESSELEYGCDDAFIVAPVSADDGADDLVVVKHLKSRHGECRDLRLRFDKAFQQFDDAPDVPAAPPITPTARAAADAMRAARRAGRSSP